MNRSLPGTKKIQIYSSDGTSEYPGVNVMSSKTIGALFSLRLLNGGLACAKDSPDQQRDKVRKMAATTLTDLYKIQAEARTAIQNSAGYAVFDNLGTNLLLGAGVAVNSKTGQDTFMKMTSVGVGLGVGVNDYRVVFVFETELALTQFIESGWSGETQADAAAKTGKSGLSLLGIREYRAGSMGVPDH